MRSSSGRSYRWGSPPGRSGCACSGGTARTATSGGSAGLVTRPWSPPPVPPRSPPRPCPRAVRTAPRPCPSHSTCGAPEGPLSSGLPWSPRSASRPRRRRRESGGSGSTRGAWRRARTCSPRTCPRTRRTTPFTTRAPTCSRASWRWRTAPRCGSPWKTTSPSRPPTPTRQPRRGGSSWRLRTTVRGGRSGPSISRGRSRSVGRSAGGKPPPVPRRRSCGTRSGRCSASSATRQITRRLRRGWPSTISCSLATR
mmetsp:Transcript_34040/g.76894  ORF Transcript_34040/g.76894 Transcript_34040/m.76894 type:complete len:254 (+) Transcript_34040:677-1438(+)